jgi:hypothetical protein
MPTKLDDRFIDDAVKTSAVQRDQQIKAQARTGEIKTQLDQVEEKIDTQCSDLDKLLAQAEFLCIQKGINPGNVTDEVSSEAEKLIALTDEEIESCRVEGLKPLETIVMQDNSTWEDYLVSVQVYADQNAINFSELRIQDLLTQDDKENLARQMREDYLLKQAHCDKYEYAIAAFWGVVCGLIDSFLVGCPGNSKLGDWSDQQCDEFVKWFAKSRGWNPKEAKKDSVASAIGFLERKGKVNYDARFHSDLKDPSNLADGMVPLNHHIKSLAHAPDIFGLFFSILDQFTDTTSIVTNDGKIVHLRSSKEKSTFELQGDTFITKVVCGASNWLIHLVSDMAGSSGGRGHNKTRGAGISMPLFEMLQTINTRVPFDNNSGKTIAELTVDLFEKGYDFRFGVAMAIPVALNSLLVRLSFSVKRYFFDRMPGKECIPLDFAMIHSQPELRRMLLVSQGVFCSVDGIDAAVRSGGELLTFALHLNFVGWSKLGIQGLMEIRLIFSDGGLDITRMDEDLERDWYRLAEENAVVI